MITNSSEEPNIVIIDSLKAILGSSPQDKLRLEDLFRCRMPSGQILGAFVSERLRDIDLEYYDFWPYLRVYGWLNET